MMAVIEGHPHVGRLPSRGMVTVLAAHGHHPPRTGAIRKSEWTEQTFLFSRVL